jgi:hypothetical protein
MKARRLIAGASFDPQTLKVVGAAFDAAWDEVAWSVNKDDPIAVESARLCLADAIFSVAHEGAVDAEALKRCALEVLARKYFIPADQKVKPQKSG